MSESFKKQKIWWNPKVSFFYLQGVSKDGIGIMKIRIFESKEKLFNKVKLYLRLSSSYPLNIFDSTIGICES